MKIFALSDMHLTFSVDKPMDKFGSAWDNQTELTRQNCERLMTDDDILLIAGDISWAMRESEVKEDLAFISSLKGKKVLLRGNHDYWWSTLGKVNRLLPAGVYAVHNTAVRIGNVVVGGNRGISLSPSNLSKEEKELYPKHYARELVRFDISIKEMQKLRREGDKTVFMTHYPPYKENPSEENEINAKFSGAGIDAVIYGHIHYKNLKALPSKKSLLTENNGVKYYLTSSDLLGHCPIEIEI